MKRCLALPAILALGCGPVVERAQRGDTLIVLGEVGEWYRVHLPERSIFAWVHAGLTSGAGLP